ncbi:MAG TPA: L,D-transpeptidase [Catenuloplanes sp.]|jgi:lipoprotein-anchoring transpeptidase ErfK/SrfK
MATRFAQRGTGPVRAILIAATLSVLVLVTGCATKPTWVEGAPAAPSVAPVAAQSPAPEPVPAAAPAPESLPLVTYDPAPKGFPEDEQALSTQRPREGLRPTGRIAAYDAPGGRPRAFLEPTLAGVNLTVPIVERRVGWVAVMLPSSSRRLAWIPPGTGWTTVPLRDQLVVYRSTHRMEWHRDDKLVKSWPVSLGVRATPTPLGRSFILGRSKLPGAVYADTEVFALGAVPEDPDALPAGLRGAHIGVHTWYNDRTLGKDSTDGCIRLTKSGQQLLLRELAPGTPVVVLDAPPAGAPTAAASAAPAA